MPTAGDEVYKTAKDDIMDLLSDEDSEDEKRP
jgi:hypothetical protein